MRALWCISSPRISLSTPEPADNEDRGLIMYIMPATNHVITIIISWLGFRSCINLKIHLYHIYSVTNPVYFYMDLSKLKPHDPWKSKAPVYSLISLKNCIFCVFLEETCKILKVELHGKVKFGQNFRMRLGGSFVHYHMAKGPIMNSELG